MTQKEALDILKTGANVFLTGEPGSGKTFTVNKYVEYLKERGVEVAITASTGIAATHLGGYTIHSWSGIGIKKNLTHYDYDFIASNERVARRIEKTKVLIIDEISMLDGDALNSVNTVCKLVKRDSRPFGGMQVLLVGDFFQLPPVSRKEENSKPAKFAFNSQTWKELSPIVCYISEQHRQEDDDFLSILGAIRKNAFGRDHMNILESQICENQESEDLDSIPKLFSHNEDVDRINKHKLDRIEDEIKFFEMQSHGRKSLVESLKRGCLSPERLELKVGAKVMFTKNNMNEGFVNGTLGEVIDFDDDSGYPIVKIKNGRRVEAAPMEWTIEENNRVKAGIMQVPLRLAWAITIHKSQGMSMDAAVMDLSQVFEFGQGYVALSRVKKLSGLYLLGANKKAFQVHPEVLEQDCKFRELSDEAQQAFASMPMTELSQMHKNFVLACGGVPEEELEKTGRKNQRERNKRREKIDTLEETLRLVEEGKSIDEVAEIRGLSRSTVTSHVLRLFSRGMATKDYLEKELSIEAAKSIDEICKIFSETKDGRLSPIFKKFGGKYSYDDLRIIRALI